MTSPRGVAALAPTIAALSGLALLAAHPPVGLWWLTFLHPPLLVAALWLDRAGATTSRSWPRALRLGALSGLVAFGPMLSWLIAPAGYVGWALLVGVQAAWMALLAVLLDRFLDHPLLPLVGAVAWTGIDAGRAIVPLNGFEWGAIAYAHADGSWMLPMARLVGGRGITFVVTLIGVAAAVAVRSTVHQVRNRGDEPVEDALRATTLPLALLVGGLLISVLATIEPPPTTGDLDVLVVQGNDIRHWEERVSDAPTTITTNLRDQTIAAIGDGPPPDLTVWPESSIDRDPTSERGANLQGLLEDAAAAAGDLIAGTTVDGPDPATERFVAAVHYAEDGTPRDRYVKRRLVPFGEYVPARALLDWFPPLDQVPRDALPGGDPHRLTTASGVPLAVLICFETLFPDILRGNILAGDDPAQLVLALTNDASFRASAEPAQHLAQSQLRAMETGRWVVHGSLSGSSAFIDPEGQIHDATPVFDVDSIRRDVPLVDGLTPYLVIGDVVGWLTRAGLIVLALVAWLRSRSSDRAGADLDSPVGSGMPG